MAEELKALIEKIQTEGIAAAQNKAKEIENQARSKADAIIKQAKEQAEKLISDANEKIAQAEQSSNASLGQAARDTILSLKKQIKVMLNKLLSERSQEALNPQELVKIISSLIKDYGKKEKLDSVVSLNKNDLEKIKDGLMYELKDEMKRGVILNPSEEIRGGFTISFDGGKSEFDFTDKALADYLSLYLNDKLKEIIG